MKALGKCTPKNNKKTYLLKEKQYQTLSTAKGNNQRNQHNTKAVVHNFQIPRKGFTIQFKDKVQSHPHNTIQRKKF
jgi:phosphate starvation-inducible protein PhoH